MSSLSTTTLVRWAAFTLLVSSGVAFALITIGSFNSDWVLAVASFLIYAGVGGLIIARRDGHPTGWLLTGIGLALTFANGIPYVPGIPGWVTEWVASWAWTAVFALFAALTLTFPSGRTANGDGLWPRLGRMAIWALPVLVAISAFTETLGGPETSSATTNPVGFLPSWMGYPSLLAVVVILLGGVASLVVRRRQAREVERAQLSWVVFAFILLITAIVGTFVVIFASIALGEGDPGDPVWSVAYAVMILFPISFGVAILRYRLYEIDRIISRTIAYVVVVGLLAVIFFGVVTAVGSLLQTESDLAIAASTLAVAAVFNPLRKRVHDIVDRRFNRSHYDAQRVIERFAGSLQGRVDSRGVVDGWVGVVSETMQPSLVAVWVRGAE